MLRLFLTNKTVNIVYTYNVCAKHKSNKQDLVFLRLCNLGMHASPQIWFKNEKF